MSFEIIYTYTVVIYLNGIFTTKVLIFTILEKKDITSLRNNEIDVVIYNIN